MLDGADSSFRIGIHISPARVAGIIVLFYTLRAQALIGDRYLEPYSWDLSEPIRRKYAGLACRWLARVQQQADVNSISGSVQYL
jgi:hypothetical protein